MSREDKAIARYNLDIQEMNGYIYTGNKARKSMDIFNARASLAVQNCVSLEGMSVLDVGCADGTFTVELVTRMKAARAVGIEPSDAWKLAQEKYCRFAPQVRFQYGSAYHLDFPDRSFDLAMMRGVLHHLDDPVQGLKEMFRVSGGVFLLEPNGYNPIIKLLEIVSPYHRAHAEKSYSPRRIRGWLQSLGGTLEGESFSSLVPLICPDGIAGFLNWLSPAWERLPLIPTISCGLYCVHCIRKGH